MFNFVEMRGDILATNSDATGVNFQATIHHGDSGGFTSAIDAEEGKEATFVNF